ncbi:SCL-interrupting locus protein homolog isoform X1 [Gadus macrocephalus]|uniref:SCL-interrupting locus protein homolog isoform X1 n=1 Tax=Gadus macrocephalus TaxID=80720 RepID=UPI0028CB3635|nr:SCL-interrupting locus protein homolog isoform X1 [Gadus macrocephalus]
MNLHGLPALVYGDVLTADTLSMTRRTTGNAPSTLAFPKSKSSLWDPSPSGDAVGLQLCYYRCPHLRVLEKALRLAHRHAHQRSNPAHQRSNPTHQRSNPALCCFLLGSICVDEDEEGVTLSLDRFDPGREQGGVRVPSLLLPGDVAVPLEFILQGDPEPSPLDLSLAFQGLQQACGGAEVADLSQLLGVRGQVSCSQQGDRLGFSLRWLAASCAGGFAVVGVRPLPIIPTALARSLSGLPGPSSPVPPRPGPSRPGPSRPGPSRPGLSRPGLSRPGLKQQRGFLTMDQTRKLLLLLESDPKACSLPLVGVWLSGVVQPSNPLVWAWCLRFSHSSSLQDRVLSEQGWFLLVLFSPSQPRFFQVRSAESGPTAVLRLSCSQHLTLFKHVEPAEGHYLQADLCLDETRQTELVHGPAARPLSSLLGATLDQDSGVEDEDLSPRPSPSPHAATQQTRRVQPSVPELSLLVDASLPPTPQPPSRRSSGPLGPPYLHSTPAAPLSRASAGFWTAKTPPTLILLHPERGSTPPGPAPPPLPCSCLQAGRPPWEEVPSDAYQMLMAQERQLRLLQAQIQMLLEPRALTGQPDGPPEEGAPPRPQTLPPTTASVAVGTGASLFWRSSPPPRDRTRGDRTRGDRTRGDRTRGDRPSSPLRDCTQELHCTSGAESPVPGTSSSLFFNTSATQSDHVLPTLQLQVSSRLQASLSDPESPIPSSPSSSSSSLPYGDHTHSYRKQEVHARSYRKQEVHARSYRKQDMSGGDEEQLGVTLDPRPDLNTEDRVAPTPTNPPRLAPTPTNPPSLARTPMDPPSLARTPMDPPSLAPTPTNPPSLARTPMDPPSLARTPMDPPSLARTPMDPPSLARTPMDPPSLARTPRDPLLPGGSMDLSLAPLLPGGSVDLSLAPLLPGGSVDLSLAPLLPGGSVDLSLEANAIALRYLSDGQLSRLSAGVRGGRADLSVLLPSNMSLATRGYMRRYGLIEEEEEEEEEQQCEGLPCATLGTGSSLPQSQLIRDLQPQLHLLARSSRTQDQDLGAVWQEASLAAGSVGNFLDVSRLRQLPKLF